MDNKQKEIAISDLAFDVALEIVLGCNCFDRQDLREFIDKSYKFNEEEINELKKKTIQYIKEQFPNQEDEFIEKELEYWFEPWRRNKNDKS